MTSRGKIINMAAIIAFAVAAVAVVYHFQTSDERLLDKYEAMLKSDDPAVKVAAVDGFIEMGEKGKEHFKKVFIDEPDPAELLLEAWGGNESTIEDLFSQDNAAEENPEIPGVSIEFAPTKNEFVIGEPVVFKYMIVNNSNEVLRFNFGVQWKGNFSFVIRNEDNSSVTIPRLKLGNPYQMGGFGIQGSWSKRITPSRRANYFELYFVLDNWHKFTKPGEYVVRCYLDNRNYFTGELEGKKMPPREANVTIKPADTELLNEAYDEYFKTTQEKYDIYRKRYPDAPSTATEALSHFPEENAIKALNKIINESEEYCANSMAVSRLVDIYLKKEPEKIIELYKAQNNEELKGRNVKRSIVKSLVYKVDENGKRIEKAQEFLNTIQKLSEKENTGNQEGF